MARTKRVKILTSTSLSGLSSSIYTEQGNGYELVTNSSPTVTGSEPSSLAWICTMVAGELSYNELNDLPTFESITLSGNQTYESLSIMPSGDYATNTALALKLTPDNIFAGEGIVIEKNGLNITVNTLVPQTLNTLTASEGSTISLSANTKYKLKTSSSVYNLTFDLPAVSTLNDDVENTVLIYLSAYNDLDITWPSNSLYYNGDEPSILAGNSDIIITADPNGGNIWCIGVMEKY